MQKILIKTVMLRIASNVMIIYTLLNECCPLSASLRIGVELAAESYAFPPLHN